MNAGIAMGLLALMSASVGILAADAPPADAQPAPPPLKIEPHFIDLKETTLAGIATFAGPQSGRFPELWKGFPQKIGEETGLETNTYSYGLELYPPNFDKGHEFTYMACMAVSDIRLVQLHLVMRTLPAARYAVFPVPGSLAGLAAAFHYIYGEWLPNSRYQRAYPFDMERYDVSPEAVKARDMPIEILVPVVDKK